MLEDKLRSFADLLCIAFIALSPHPSGSLAGTCCHLPFRVHERAATR